MPAVMVPVAFTSEPLLPVTLAVIETGLAVVAVLPLKSTSFSLG